MTTILAIFGLAFAFSLALTPAARWVGIRLGAVDVPNERKIHTQPMARTGGLSILGGAKTQMGAILLIPALGLGVPLFDTVLAPTRRFIRGQKLFSPDRNHIHHRLREMGFSTRSVTLVLYGASLVLCLCAVILVNLRNEQAGLFLIILGGVAVLAVRKLGIFGGFTSANVMSWLKDMTDVTGISHERRSFLNIQMDLSASKDLEGMWANMVRGLQMLGFDAGEMALNGTEDGGQRTEGRRDGETEDAECRAEGETEAGALRHLVPSSLSHEQKGVAGICPVCGEVHHTADGWHATWGREGFDLEKDICEKCLLKLELPLLPEDGAFLGALWLVKDLKREPVSHYTLRRIEHLRRTLTATLANLQSSPKSKP